MTAHWTYLCCAGVQAAALIRSSCSLPHVMSLEVMPHPQGAVPGISPGDGSRTGQRLAGEAVQQ